MRSKNKVSLLDGGMVLPQLTLNRPETLRTGPQRPDNVIDKDTSAESDSSSPSDDQQSVHDSERPYGSTEDATGDDRQDIDSTEEPDDPTQDKTGGFERHRMSNEGMEQKIKDCLLENRSSYGVAELCVMFPGYEPESLVRAWYRVRERMKRKKHTALSSLRG
jgi:hypothetical protein